MSIAYGVGEGYLEAIEQIISGDIAIDMSSPIILHLGHNRTREQTGLLAGEGRDALPGKSVRFMFPKNILYRITGISGDGTGHIIEPG